jgi:asparagine synthase (glutamine-hydrolysing)
VRAARDNRARVILDGHGGELSASCVVSGYLAELLLAGRWKSLLRELKAANSKGVITVPVLKGLVLRPLVPYILLKWLNRHDRFGDLIPFSIKKSYIRDVLGPGADGVKEQVLRLPDDRPDHRKNMAHNLLLERGDIRQRSCAGFIGYQDTAFSYPFLDRRVLEFALAVDGRFKHRDGRERLLLRLGMEGLLPRKILSRNSKVPFAPDYHLRYERQKGQAMQFFGDFVSSAKLAKIVDFQRVLDALTSTPAYDAESPMRGDHEAQFTVPCAAYLCYFLDRFAS